MAGRRRTRHAPRELGWEAAVADYRHAEALAQSGAPRSEVAAPLRAAYRFATEQAAVPLTRDIETLALSTRVPLTEPKPNATWSGTGRTG